MIPQVSASATLQLWICKLAPVVGKDSWGSVLQLVCKILVDPITSWLLTQLLLRGTRASGVNANSPLANSRPYCGTQSTLGKIVRCVAYSQTRMRSLNLPGWSLLAQTTVH